MLVFDIETNAFDPLNIIPSIHTIWTLTIFDGVSYKRYDNKDVIHGIQRLHEADYICGHNIIGFDVPAIKQVYPWFNFKGTCVDTMVWAGLVFSNIKATDYNRWHKGMLHGSLIGSHSLKAWGQRLGFPKGDYGDQDEAWDKWTPEMSEYCEQDVRVTVRLLGLLEKRPEMPDAWELEHDVKRIISRQERHGFLFDEKKAAELYSEWLPIRDKLEAELQGAFPKFYKKATRKTFTPKQDCRKRAGLWVGYVKGAECQKVQLVDFNPYSNAHVSRMLLSKYDWIPNEFTEKDKVSDEVKYHYERLGIDSKMMPKIDEDILNSLPYPEIESLAKAWTINKRIAQLAEAKKAWMRLVAGDGRIHGSVMTGGAVTGRMTHFNPNMAQVPSVNSPYGAECRSLFIVPIGYKLIGCDASGIEARCLAHFMAKYDDGAYIKVILEGNKEDGTDVHSLNAKALGCDRNTAKTWFYGFMYGAGDKKLASILGCSVKKAKAKKKEFFEALPALKKLIDAVQGAVKKRGYLRGLDGRHLICRSQHSALNLLLQSAGALIMKKALVILDGTLQNAGYTPGKHYEFVANVHDEYQIEGYEDFTEDIGGMAVQAIVDAGKYFNFRCPLDGEYMVGDNWLETH